MIRRILYFLAFVTVLAACSDDDSFGTSQALRLSFGTDTLQLDTVFCRVPSSTYTFWVYNHNEDGIRLQTVRLRKGNQTGFRVNVDGEYLDNSNGSIVNNLELRQKDSLLVFVELTPTENGKADPQLIEDEIVFSLESGVEQQVVLQAWTWDAQRLYSPIVTHDSLINSRVPIIIYGGLTVAEGATLSIHSTTIYFHDQAGLDVYGSLQTEQCLMRGDRLDHMFSYLPYDRVSGQWKGVRFYETSSNNHLKTTEIRNTVDAIICDSSALDATTVRLRMDSCIVHNCGGYGVKATNANISLDHCQITNTQADCLSLTGGICRISQCTLAQFYPFSAARGAALDFSNRLPLVNLYCEGSILTGYDEDVVMGDLSSDDNPAEYLFVNSLLRTPRVDTADSLRFINILWETQRDSVEGKHHFKLIDEENLIYDFHLDSISTAKGLGCY